MSSDVQACFNVSQKTVPRARVSGHIARCAQPFPDGCGTGKGACEALIGMRPQRGRGPVGSYAGYSLEFVGKLEIRDEDLGFGEVATLTGPQQPLPVRAGRPSKARSKVIRVSFLPSTVIMNIS